jgi:hypothetical protein
MVAGIGYKKPAASKAGKAAEVTELGKEKAPETPSVANATLRDVVEKEMREIAAAEVAAAQSQTQPQSSIEAAVEASAPEAENFVCPSYFIPSAIRLYPTYLKVDRKRLFSDEEFNKICKLVSGDPRRAIHRVLVGVYQRSHKLHDDAEIKRARLMLSLHESRSLTENLETL